MLRFVGNSPWFLGGRSTYKFVSYYLTTGNEIRVAVDNVFSFIIGLWFSVKAASFYLNETVASLSNAERR